MCKRIVHVDVRVHVRYSVYINQLRLHPSRHLQSCEKLKSSTDLQATPRPILDFAYIPARSAPREYRRLTLPTFVSSLNSQISFFFFFFFFLCVGSHFTGTSDLALLWITHVHLMERPNPTLLWRKHKTHLMGYSDAIVLLMRCSNPTYCVPHTKLI